MRTKLVEWVIFYARWLILGGLALGLTGGRFGGAGAVTCGTTAIWLGTCGACFRGWREEPGLWMLSGLFLAMTLPGFAILACGKISEIAQAPVPGPLDYDTWGAVFVLAVQVLFLATVTRTNWSLKKSKKPVMPEL